MCILNKVIIAEGDNALDRIFIELEVEKMLQNIENTLIKPNLRAAGIIKYKKCSITNPLIVKSLAERLLDLGKYVTIAECTSSKYITQKALENSGIKSLEKIGVDILNLNSCKTKNIKISGGTLKEIEVPLPIVNGNFVISLPVMKTHNQTLVTLSMKNMMGATSEMGPSRMHCAGIHQSIADINTVVKPHLCIIDATRAMEGSGPVRGSEVILNTLISGYDPVSVDSISATIMGYDPRKIEHILLAEEKGVGNIKPDIVIGNINARNFVKPGDDGVKYRDLYSFKWFNLLMSNRIIHTLTYDYFYYLWKKVRKNKEYKKCTPISVKSDKK